jgi:hypothetical protein
MTQADSIQAHSGARLLRDPALLWGLALCAFLLGAFLAVPYLPMVDMPQHAAQISIWQRLGDPHFPETELFELNLRTPYLGAYALARALCGALGVVPALKVVTWLAIVGHWAAFAWLVRTTGHARWLGVFGVPLGMGYGFYFGFISFIGALPFGLAAVSLALRHRERATWLSGLLLGAALCATLATHGFALGLTVVLVAPLLLRGSSSLIARAAPLLAPVLLIVVWLMPGSSARAIGLTVWDPRFWELGSVPALWLAANSADVWATALGLIILACVALSLGRPSRAPERHLPIVVLVLGFCLFPLSFGGFTPLHPRFAAFVIPALLLAFEPRTAPRFAVASALADSKGRTASYLSLPRAERPLALGVMLSSAVWLALFAVRLHRFQQETRPISDFIARMPAHLRIRPVVFERTSRVFPSLPVLIHLSAYYVPVKAGVQGYSFAMYPTSVIRYQPFVTPTMTQGSEWRPDWFSADELPGYDCVLVHSTSDPSFELFGERLAQVSLAFHEQGWWAYMPHATL